jgi:hypothetical protein
MTWVLLIASIVLGLWHSPWWWIPAGLLAIWQAHGWYFHNGRPWRKVHYPLMRTYAAACGQEQALANQEGRSFEVLKAVDTLLQDLKPEWDSDQRRQFVDEQLHRCESFSDERLVIQEFRRRNRELGDSDEKRVRELCLKILSPPLENITIAQFIAAALIEERYGIQDRGEYLFEVFSGVAK